MTNILLPVVMEEPAGCGGLLGVVWPKIIIKKREELENSISLEFLSKEYLRHKIARELRRFI